MVAYSFKSRFCEPILLGLGHTVATEAQCFPKRQTIRAVGKRRHARPGETLQLYTGMRTRQCRKIGEARCLASVPIRIFVEAGRIEVDAEDPAMRLFHGIGLGYWPK